MTVTNISKTENNESILKISEYYPASNPICFPTIIIYPRVKITTN